MIDTLLDEALEDAVGEGVEEQPPSADKCEHGNRITPGDETARYCSGCNPSTMRIIAPQRRVPQVTQVEYLYDSADYIDLPVGQRLAASEAYAN